jgi:predicted peroxiredoxin
MAIDQTNVALTIADKAVQQTTQFLEAFEELEDILNQATQAGINMTNFDAALATSSVKHVDGATINKLAAIIPALQTFLASNSVTGTTYKQALYKIKS